MPLHFFSEDISFKLKNKNILKNWIKIAIQSKGKKIGAINYIFCSDTYLLNLNNTYLKHNTLTDIITFPHEENNLAFVSGDIYISIDRVGENATFFCTNFNFELFRVMAHGVLHLTGFKDKTKEEKAIMRQEEDAFLIMLKSFLPEL